MPHISLENYTRSICEHSIYKKITTIGSAPDNDIVCVGPGVEPSHALFYIEPDGYWIEPLSRKAEVYINGSRAKKKAAIHNQDKVTIGTLAGTFSHFDIPPKPVAQTSSDISDDSVKVMQKLQKLADALTNDYTVSTLLDHIMDEVIALVNAERGFLVLIDEGVPHVRVARNVRQETILDADGFISDSIVRRVIETKLPLILSDACSDKNFKNSESVVKLQLSSIMCAPLLDRGRLIGVIYVGNNNIVNLFQNSHLEMLKIFASQTSLILANALLVDDLTLRNRSLETQLENLRFGKIIGNCYAMREIFQMVEKVAPTDVSVLIEGETGTGKELIAEELHRRSHRNGGPFVVINCGAIPADLLESELFGHVKGAFTGATYDKQGRFQQANGGTLFLDEIGEMPLELQVKLLRALQERCVCRVGSNRIEPVDIRVIAATNRHLEEEVENRRFREDLLYRLNVITLALPPLRERDEDVILIAHAVIEREAKGMGIVPKNLSPEAVQAMRKYAWPGNIRQLQNRIKKGLILSNGNTITPRDLDLEPECLKPVETLAEAKANFQRRYINEILERNHGNRTKTAADLGVDPRTIFRHLENEKDYFSR